MAGPGEADSGLQVANFDWLTNQERSKKFLGKFPEIFLWNESKLYLGPRNRRMSTTTSRSRTSKRSSRTALSKSRSSSRRPVKRSLFPKRSYALAAPHVGLGMSATTVLRTSFFYNATSPASGVFAGFLKPGSCFDPCGDLAAIQPQMFDQWAAMYSRYKVNHATVIVKITGASSSANAWVAAAYPSVDSTALTTYQGAASQQYAKTTSGGFQISGALGVGAEGKYLTFKKISHDSVVGAKSDTWDIGASVTADPTTGQFMVLPFFIQANTAAVGNWVLEIDIFQNVTFSQKKNVVDA